MRLITIIASIVALAGTIAGWMWRRGSSSTIWLGQGTFEQHG